MFGYRALMQPPRRSSSEPKAVSTDDKIRWLEDRIERLAMACQTLWEILSEQMGIDDDVFEEKLSEIDLRDGVEDGKMTKSVQVCNKCHRKVHRRHRTCLYCGEPIVENERFKEI